MTDLPVVRRIMPSIVVGDDDFVGVAPMKAPSLSAIRTKAFNELVASGMTAEQAIAHLNKCDK